MPSCGLPPRGASMSTASYADSLPPAVDNGRPQQTFPVLTAGEIARIQRFGRPVGFRRGERLYAAGEPSPGLFLVLKGSIAAVQRDGLGAHGQLTRHSPGQFTGEVGTLSGGPALVDGVAEEDVEALL